MSTPILATKLFIPPARREAVLRSVLIARLNEGISRKLTLISAAAGFGKTTLLSEWVANCAYPVAWLSLDEGDKDPTRFLAYFVAALQTIMPEMGQSVMTMLQSPQPPATTSVLTPLLNELATAPQMLFVLDDYHLVDSPAVDEILLFLLAHLPPQMHLVVATREDPPLPLARLRARGQLHELRAADLRFSLAETAVFLKQSMGLNLSQTHLATLETRTEGWPAGLQLAALALQGQAAGSADAANFIQTFSGSHRFVLDYLVEEVLQQQPAPVQSFLLTTSILERMSSSLCAALLDDPAVDSQHILAYLEQHNLFVVPLDGERHWYRYHHLFGDLLRQRLSLTEAELAQLHLRASEWYEAHGFDIDAFQHATLANDIERAERLMAGDGMPLQFRGAMLLVMNWLGSLDTAVFEARPSLRITYAAALTMAGQPLDEIEAILQAAESGLDKTTTDETTRDLIGQIAAIRAMLAIPNNQLEVIGTQSERALQYLHPDNLAMRTNATWTLGLANQFKHEHAAAIEAFSEVLSIAQTSGNTMSALAAATCLGQIYEAENKPQLAVENYQHVLQLAGEPPVGGACEAALGLARIHYQWNELDAAAQYAQLGYDAGMQLETVDTPAVCQVVLAQLKLVQDDVTGAAALLAQAEQLLRQRHLLDRLPLVGYGQVLTKLHVGDVRAAAELAQTYDLLLAQARVHWAQQETAVSLEFLATWRQQMESQKMSDELLKGMPLQALVYEVDGQTETAVAILEEALNIAQPTGYIRLFVDEGEPMRQLLAKQQLTTGHMREYVQKLLVAFAAPANNQAIPQQPQPLLDALSEREIEVLQLVAEGLSNREVADRLYLSPHTVKVHARNIYSKLDVKNRTQAVAKARELNILPSS